MQWNRRHLLGQERQAGCHGGSSPPRVELEIVRGRAEHRRRPVTVPAFLIGSALDCDLVLAAPKFPEVHAYFRLTESGVVVRHLGFAPLLRINGCPVSSARLQHGDRLTTGPFEFALHIHTMTTDPFSTWVGCRSTRSPGTYFDRPADPFEAMQETSEGTEIEPRTQTSVPRLYIEHDRNGSGRLSSP